MKLVRHPNVVRLHEVIRAQIIKHFYLQLHRFGAARLCLDQQHFATSFHYGTTHNFTFYLQVLASRTKIYIILEFVTGGELFDKIVSFWTYCILEVFAPSLLLGLGCTLCCFAVSWLLFLASSF